MTHDRGRSRFPSCLDLFRQRLSGSSHRALGLLFGFASHGSPTLNLTGNVRLCHFRIRLILSTQLRVDVYHPWISQGCSCPITVSSFGLDNSLCKQLLMYFRKKSRSLVGHSTVTRRSLEVLESMMQSPGLIPFPWGHRDVYIPRVYENPPDAWFESH